MEDEGGIPIFDPLRHFVDNFDKVENGEKKPKKSSAKPEEKSQLAKSRISKDAHLEMFLLNQILDDPY
jgi:hypothetical protein